MRIILGIIWLCIQSNILCFSNDTIKSIRPIKIKTNLLIDGVLDEQEWGEGKIANDFINHYPVDKGPAANKTIVNVLHNDTYLYIGVTSFYQGQRPVIQSLKRDSPWWTSEAVAVVIDPTGSKTNGVLFSVNAGGSQSDAIVDTQGSYANFDINWDTQWFSAVTVSSDHWTVEIAIPFKMLRYKEADLTWTINFFRFDLANNTRSSWNSVPVNFPHYNLHYNGNLEWDTPPPEFKGNISIAPFATTRATLPEGEGENTKSDYDFGVEGKIPLSASLNLDFTINPDFSQVDVDQQVINLTRFSVYFPERRSFFLENSNLFANMGVEGIRPFFSRQIGLKEGQTIPIIAGIRFTGNIHSSQRVGLLNVTTREIKDSLYQNYTVGAFQQTVFKNSIIQGIFTSRDAIDKYGINEFDYNRTVGLEFKYLNKNERWNLIGRYHKAFQKDIAGTDDQYMQLGITHSVRQWYIDFNALRVGENYVNDLGFTPLLYQYDPITDQSNRIGYTQNFNEVYYRIFTNEPSKVAFHGPKLLVNSYFRGGDKVNEAELKLFYEFNFKNLDILNFGVENNYVDLFYPLYLVGEKFVPLPAQSFSFMNYIMNYEQGPSRAFAYTLRGEYGQFYNGTRLAISPSFRLRAQPWSSFRLQYTYNHLDFPGAYGSGEFHLIGSSAEISFSNKMFWTTFFQYNTQLDNVNINSRFQWRYRPLSDLFVVYTDNYTNDFTKKSRGVVLKFVYWFNIGFLPK